MENLKKNYQHNGTSEKQLYLNHYNLTQRPFSISPDPRFLWLGEKHAEALATLKYGILDNKGFLLITGEVGTGKTILIRSLVKQIDAEVTLAVIPDPRLSLIDFTIYWQMNLEWTGDSKAKETS